MPERRMDHEEPWDWMQPYDVRRFGEVILDKNEQESWCRAVLLGVSPPTRHASLLNSL
jgi:hypothetical protein